VNQVVFALSIVAVVPLIAIGFWLTVKARRKRQELQLVEPERPSTSGVEAGRGEPVYYLATTYADRPLERIWAYRLGGRGNATLIIGDAIELHRTGEPGLLIQYGQVTGFGRASATIDRGVERDGLTTLNWMLGEQEVSTVLRFVSQESRANFEATIGAKIG
jgi:hypothetical protein